MHDDAIFSELSRILREHVHYVGPIAPQMDLRQDLGLDSLQQLTLIVETENAFALCLAPDADTELATLGDVVAYIRAEQAKDRTALAEQSARPA